MTATENSSPIEKSASGQIDAIIRASGDWRGKKLAQLRALIKQADPLVVEEVKWKKPSKPEGVPVWSQLKRQTIQELARMSVLPASSLASRHAWMRSGRSTR